MPPFKIRVTKDSTSFCAGHFITYEGDHCETLHGHNYRAAASLEGTLTESAYVFDFVVLKHLLRSICDRLDHRILLPRDNSKLTLQEDGPGIMVRYGEKLYRFPREDVVLLPIPNTTAEMLAEWIGREIAATLPSASVPGLTALEVEVEEAIGQQAFWRKEISGDA